MTSWSGSNPRIRIDVRPDTIDSRGPKDDVKDTDARLWHPWLRINRVLRVMLHTRWSTEAWPQVKAEFNKVLALRSEISAGGVVQLTRSGTTVA
jgi:hypothetical protein